jgi:copper chaperone CopZ
MRGTGEILSSKDIKEKTVSAEHETKGEKAGKSRMIVSVKDISCVTCGLAIEKQVKKIKGVKDVRTAVMLNKVFIDYDSKLVDSGIIRKAIDKTGYKSYMHIEEQKR